MALLVLNKILNENTNCFKNKICKKLCASRFHKDLRVFELSRCLSSSSSQAIFPEHEFFSMDSENQKIANSKYSFMAFEKSCASSLGRAMFYFSTNSKFWSMASCRPEYLSTISHFVKSKIKIPIDTKNEKFPVLNDWGMFYSSAAYGLSAKPGLPHVSREEINKLSYGMDNSFMFAGFFFAMGACGYCKKLTSTDLFHLFQNNREIVSASVLLGFSIDGCGSKNHSIRRMIGLFIPSINSQIYPKSEKIKSLFLQRVSLVSIGFLYLSSGDVYISKVVSDILKKSVKNFKKSGLSFTAGLSLGLINFGVGCIGNDYCCELDKTLYKYSREGQLEPLTQKNTPCCWLSKNMDLFISAPGALLALGLIHFRTNNKYINFLLRSENSIDSLNRDRPEFAFYRVLSRILIMWDSIQPSFDWLESQIPSTVWSLSKFPPVLLNKLKNKNNNFYQPTIDNFFLYYVLGCSLALALKFAGSLDRAVFRFLMSVYDSVLRSFRDVNHSSIFFNNQQPNTPSETIIEVSLFVQKMFSIYMLLFMSIIMAGSGSLRIFRIARIFWSNDLFKNPFAPTYTMRNREIISMTMGFLFLNGGKSSLKQTKPAIAGILVSVIPLLISPSLLLTESYSSVFSYFWVLAVEKRYIKTVLEKTKIV